MKCGETTEQNIKRFGTAECDKDKGKWNRACKRRDITALKVGILVSLSLVSIITMVTV